MAEYGKRCDKCNKLFQVGEFFITFDDKESFCKPCVRDKLKCDGCFQSPEINSMEDVPRLARRGEKCPKCGKTLFGGEPCFCDMNDLNKCLKCGKFVQGGVEECIECASRNDNLRKCDVCKTRKATIFPLNPNDKSAFCEECNQKRPRGPKGNQEKREQIKIIFEKILERCPEEAFKPLGEQNGKKNWCVYTPIWVKRITKEEARELKELCQGANPKFYGGGIPYELDKIIGGKESEDKENNQYTCERFNYFCIDGDYGNSVKKGNKKEGLKREVLFWREYAKELEKKLANQNNLTPEEKQQANYLKKLQQNTLNSAENAYSSKYGKLTEDNPNDNKGKGMSGGVIALLVVGGIVIMGGIIFLLTRGRKKIRKQL
ncbi:7335_t:CDS:2 [Scutellospora calospora]|uniref:7335_t:CDS:1 n=1 Tax=Scutellospora calospora TaxID=85575 RepID=A0ACA9K4F6_9GLOM|nr:7335_t:CDS:2 [Scutellospora calospora]